MTSQIQQKNSAFCRVTNFWEFDSSCYKACQSGQRSHSRELYIYNVSSVEHHHMVSIFPEDPKNSALPQRHALWSHHPSSLKAHRTSVFGRHSMHPALKGVRSPGQFTKQLTSSGKNCKVGKPINSYSYNSITVMGWWYYDYCSPMVDDTMTMDDYSYNSIIIGQTCGPQLSSKSHDIHRHQDLPTSKIYCEDSIHQLIQEETIIHKYNIWLVVDLPLWKIWLRQLGWWNSLKFPI